METLALKLAEVLQITMDKAIELLPVIQKQFITYNIINIINDALLFPFIILLAVSGFIWIMYLVHKEYIDSADEYPDSYWKSEKAIARTSKKLIKPLTIGLLIMFVVEVILNILLYVLAPQFMIIKEFIL